MYFIFWNITKIIDYTRDIVVQMFHIPPLLYIEEILPLCHDLKFRDVMSRYMYYVTYLNLKY